MNSDEKYEDMLGYLEILVDHMSNLKCQGLGITYIHNKFNSLWNLTILDLSNNKIDWIQNLRELDWLELLDLSDNKISRITSEDARELPEGLVTLDLRGNLISVLKDFSHLNELLNLSHLYIQKTKIS